MCFHAYSGYEQKRTMAKKLNIDNLKIYKSIMAPWTNLLQGLQTRRLVLSNRNIGH